MLVSPEAGLRIDQPPVSPSAFWRLGYNIRFRLGNLETIGLFGPLPGPTGAQITLPGSDVYRTIFTTPSTVTGQILAGSTSRVSLLQFDPAASTPGAPPRWAQFDVTPSPLPAASDVLTEPNSGRVEIPPVWWFADQDDTVVGSRTNVPGEPCYAWNRNSASRFAAIPLARNPADPEFANGWTGPPGVGGAPAADPANPPTPAPTGAVGGAIVNRILVLLGASSFTEPNPLRYMTVRWSDRFNFGQWTPSDVTISGELQLEGGSRIVGGGYSSFGVLAWTDRRLAVLTETFDPDSVFARRYIDGSRGLLANLAWCEADGVVWWLDETRTLNAYDGGRPRQIPSPLKAGTLERMADKETARVFMQANPEYNEVLAWFPSGPNVLNPDACVVFNYVENAWSYWRMDRSAWCPRFGVIPNLAISSDRKVWKHDLDVSLPGPWVDPLSGSHAPGPLPRTTPPVAEVTPFDFLAVSNLIVAENVTTQVWRGNRIMMDHLPSPAIGAEGDTITLQAIGFGETSLTSAQMLDEQVFSQGQAAADFRVEGKALMLRIVGTNQKTVWRLGAFDIGASQGGQR
jgi:hypothetical protein